MAKRKFMEEFKNRVLEKFGEARAIEEVILHSIGEVPETEEAKQFVRDTNCKYFGVDTSASLLGNFAEIKMLSKDSSKHNFIRLDMDELYQHPWQEIMENVGEQLGYAETIESNASDVLDSFSDYQRIKGRLIIRPLNYTAHKGRLNGYVYRVIGDIALVLYVVVMDDEANSVLNTTKVPSEIAEQWDISREDLFSETMVNTMKFSPARIYTNILAIEDTLDSESALMEPGFIKKHLSDNAIPLVTTARKTNGAVSLFYPGVKEKIAEMFDGSFYVAFTSIHEAMLHKTGSHSPESIKRHLVATNRAFGSAETLTSEVYYYNKDTKEFTVCAID